MRLDILPVVNVLNEVAENRVHIRLAYNSPPHSQIDYRATSPQPVMLLVRADHPLAMRGTTVSVEDILGCQLVLTTTTFGIGHAIQMLKHAEKIEIRPPLVSNSLAALKQLVASGDFASLAGEFAAYREIEKGLLAAILVDPPLLYA